MSNETDRSVSFGSLRVGGKGDSRQAARSAHDVAAALAEAVPGVATSSLHIDKLSLTLPAGSKRAEIVRAIQAALAKQTGDRRR
jgi:hypothetical protein